MSDRLPFHIQEEIMKRLPVKSLVRFRSVSKAWKSLIDSPEFITAHSLCRQTQPHYLLISHENPAFEEHYVLFSRCYTDDGTFPQERFVPTLPQSIQQLNLSIVVVGSSHGLLCLYAFHPDFTPPPVEIAVIWNPSIRKSIVVDVPCEPYFGVCPVTSDPKIVAFTHPSKANVYTLNSGIWRSVSTNLSDEQTLSILGSIVTDRFIYWDVELQNLNLILSFDLTNESFEMIEFPLIRRDTRFLGISKLRDSLALIECEYGEDYSFSTVWMLEDGARRSFTKLFTITAPHEHIVGFMKNGMPMVKVRDDNECLTLNKLVVYEPNSEHNNVLEICPTYHAFMVDSYMETLLLLGQSDCNSY